MSDPLTPYAGTSGWSGSSASEDRARTQDADGTTSDRQKAVRFEVGRRNTYGSTVKEVCYVLGLHHGQGSSALSVLHKEGIITRLAERRNRCSIYVLPEHVNGRETSDHGRSRPVPVVPLSDDEAIALARVHQAVEKADSVKFHTAYVAADALATIINALEARS